MRRLAPLPRNRSFRRSWLCVVSVRRDRAFPHLHSPLGRSLLCTARPLQQPFSGSHSRKPRRRLRGNGICHLPRRVAKPEFRLHLSSGGVSDEHALSPRGSQCSFPLPFSYEQPIRAPCDEGGRQSLASCMAFRSVCFLVHFRLVFNLQGNDHHKFLFRAFLSMAMLLSLTKRRLSNRRASSWTLTFRVSATKSIRSPLTFSSQASSGRKRPSSSSVVSLKESRRSYVLRLYYSQPKGSPTRRLSNLQCRLRLSSHHETSILCGASATLSIVQNT